jgi:hypothetical protein
MQTLTSVLKRFASVAAGFRGGEDSFVEESPELAFHWSGPMSSGQTLAIAGINGAVCVRGVAGGEVRLAAIRRGSRSQMKDVRVAVERKADGVKVRAIYPRRIRMGWRSQVEVNFMLEIPAGVRLVARVENGGINVKSVNGEAELFTANGVVSIYDSGWVSAEAINGYIHASIREPNWGRPLRFRTVNGSIRVELPSSASARIRARTVNGIVSASFPLAIEQKRHNFLSGVLGSDAGRELLCECGNGSVHLSQAV